MGRGHSALLLPDSVETVTAVDASEPVPLLVPAPGPAPGPRQVEGGDECAWWEVDE